MNLDQQSAAAGFDNLPDAGFVRVQVVAAIYGISVPTVWRWARPGSKPGDGQRIPAPKKLGPATTAWNVGELRAALAKAA